MKDTLLEPKFQIQTWTPNILFTAIHKSCSQNEIGRTTGYHFLSFRMALWQNTAASLKASGHKDKK